MARAEHGDENGSISLEEALNTLHNVVSDGTDSAFEEVRNQAWDKFWKSNIFKKIKTLATIMATRRPAWEVRVSTQEFNFLGGAFSAEVRVYYEINRVDNLVVVRLIDAPGPSAN